MPAVRPTLSVRPVAVNGFARESCCRRIRGPAILLHARQETEDSRDPLSREQRRAEPARLTLGPVEARSA